MRRTLTRAQQRIVFCVLYGHCSAVVLGWLLQPFLSSPKFVRRLCPSACQLCSRCPSVTLIAQFHNELLGAPSTHSMPTFNFVCLLFLLVAQAMRCKSTDSRCIKMGCGTDHACAWFWDDFGPDWSITASILGRKWVIPCDETRYPTTPLIASPAKRHRVQFSICMRQTGSNAYNKTKGESYHLNDSVVFTHKQRGETSDFGAGW